MVLFEDSAALLGILIAAAGTFSATHFQKPEFDGLASLLIGLVLGGVAMLLARESKSLLIGESASPELTRAVKEIASRNPAVLQVNGMLTAQLAPDQILIALSLEFADNLRVPELEERVIEIEASIRAQHPEVTALFVKPQTPKVFSQNVRDRFEIEGDG
jgi:divalent metal cation (Fe/Co/Zn/Cd) transporter